MTHHSQHLRRQCAGDGAQKKIPRASDRGIALVITLLLLSLMTALGLAMVLSINADMLINGYYRNYRGAFYAADAGVNVARAQLVNQIVAAVPAVATTPPLTAASEAAVRNFVTNNYGGAYGSIQSASSWNESFKITDVQFSRSACNVTASTSNPPGTCDADTHAISYQYIYKYSLTSSGRALSNQLMNVKETGNVTINIVGTPNSQSFAGYGMFIDQQNPCSGTYLVPGLITGPVFTNGSWTFGATGNYIFTDPVGSAGANAGFQFSGSCSQSPAGTFTSGAQTIAPNFQSGFNWGQGQIPLPQNSFQQKRAVLDGVGTNTSNPTNAELNASLRNASGTQYPTGGASSGVYLPYSVDPSSGAKSMTGGGFYIEGDASVVLTASTDAGGNPTQTYAITQGGTTTTIVTNASANTTTVTSAGTTSVITGLPRNYNNGTPAAMLFVDGNITGLKGPGQGVPAVQDGTALTITAQNDVTITGDVLYKTEPVTFTQNQIVSGTNPPCCNGTPADTLIPGANKGQTLGIFTTSGNVKLNNGQANGNLEIDASVATISAGGSGGITNVGAQINTLNIVGGRIQNTIQNINTVTRNVFFDRRYAPGTNFAPPWFPSTSLGAAVAPTITVPSVQRVSWVTTPQ
jgi:Tfp pilus assembly protein PilX